MKTPKPEIDLLRDIANAAELLRQARMDKPRNHRRSVFGHTISTDLESIQLNIRRATDKLDDALLLWQLAYPAKKRK